MVAMEIDLTYQVSIYRLHRTYRVLTIFLRVILPHALFTNVEGAYSVHSDRHGLNYLFLVRVIVMKQL